MKKIIAIVGARPQFIKHAPLSRELNKCFLLKTIHTGQHYDYRLSKIIFDELSMSDPDYFLKIGSHSHGMQTGLMLIEIEKILIKEMPSAVLVYGDTNSTLAGAISAVKLGLPVIHIEAGLRGFNRDLPEEINRVVTDHVSTLLFAPTLEAVKNLEREGISQNVVMSGDVMLDAILLAKSLVNSALEGNYFLLTLHRPYNTDNIVRLLYILESIDKMAEPVIFPIHPRTMLTLKSNGVDIEKYKNIKFVAPKSYLELIKLQMSANGIITDSGGIQKEAYILGKRCITIRKETEWIETLKGNWNILVYEDLENLRELFNLPLTNYNDSLFGNGSSSAIITKAILKLLQNEN